MNTKIYVIYILKVKYNSTQYNTNQYITIQCSTKQYKTTQYNTSSVTAGKKSVHICSCVIIYLVPTSGCDAAVPKNWRSANGHICHPV